MPFDVGGFPDLPPHERGAHRGAVALWLFVVCGMIWVMVILGGLTRLTGSGLAIMEWAPVTGVLPPLNHADWESLYRLYQKIPQYKLVNDGFGLAGFQRIFWLEWVHRLWGRLIGVVFFVPLVWFWVRGRLPRGLPLRLAGFFVLGGLQGAVGWFMVSSGFFPDATAVAPARLVLHLALALALYAAILWTGLSVLHPVGAAPPGTRGLRRAVACALGLLSCTIVAGGFVAGTHAGLEYNTFPLMDGRLVPAGYARLHPFLRNLTQNLAAVQFDHRLLATATVLAILVALGLALRPGVPGAVRRPVLALAGLAAIQFALGVATLLLVVPVPLASAHQANAVLVLTAGLVALHALRRQPARSTAGRPPASSAATPPLPAPSGITPALPANSTVPPTGSPPGSSSGPSDRPAPT
jgi:cytochrome c oxidase assembly protein subunit 15